MTTLPAPATAGATSLLRKLARSIAGTAAIEFAYIAPLLLVMLLGTIEVSRAVSIDRRFGLVTSMLSDLVSREKTLGTSQAATILTLQGMMDSAKAVMTPYASDNLTIKIRDVWALNASDTSKGTVKWSYTCTTTSCVVSTDVKKCDAYDLKQAGLLSPGSSVIVVDSNFGYKRVFTSWTGNTLSDTTWTDKSIHSPRQSCVDDGNSGGCSTAPSC